MIPHDQLKQIGVGQTLDAVEKGLSEVLTDDWTRQVKDAVATDQDSLYPDIQRRWDVGESPWKD
jgi:hypothetical protein